MTEAKAKLLYVVNAPDGRLLLNVQTEDGSFSQIEMSQNHLAGIIVDGVKMLVEAIAPRRIS